jgi:hypothetical protein
MNKLLLVTLCSFSSIASAKVEYEKTPEVTQQSSVIKYDATPRLFIFKPSDHTLSDDGEILVCVEPNHAEYKVGPNVYECLDKDKQNAFHNLNQIAPNGFKPDSYEYKIIGSKIILFVYFKPFKVK